MEKLKQVWIRYATPQNVRVAYVLLVLASLAIAAGAPGGGGGNPGAG